MFDLAKPTQEMNDILSKNCPEDLFLRVIANLEDTGIISHIKFLPEEEKIYGNLENHFLGTDWNIYDAPSCYSVEKVRIHPIIIPHMDFMEAGAFITVPFYIIPKEITYFEYWLENYFHFPILMDKLHIDFMKLDKLGIYSGYQLKNTIVEKRRDHLFIGSFARVSDGWKFYPRMQFHKNLEIKGM